MYPRSHDSTAQWPQGSFVEWCCGAQNGPLVRQIRRRLLWDSSGHCGLFERLCRFDLAQHQPWIPDPLAFGDCSEELRRPPGLHCFSDRPELHDFADTKAEARSVDDNELRPLPK